jgi:carbonic anhydrase/acetyltransferase-like protein (isoleucine patch superfamily)
MRLDCLVMFHSLVPELQEVPSGTVVLGHVSLLLRSFGSLLQSRQAEPGSDHVRSVARQGQVSQASDNFSGVVEN